MASSSRSTECGESAPLLRGTVDEMDDSIGNGQSSQNDVIGKHVTTVTTPVERKEIKENLAKYEQLFGADEDDFEQPTTTREELWSYYLYYNVRSDPGNT